MVSFTSSMTCLDACVEESHFCSCSVVAPGACPVAEMSLTCTACLVNYAGDGFWNSCLRFAASLPCWNLAIMFNR